MANFESPPDFAMVPVNAGRSETPNRTLLRFSHDSPSARPVFETLQSSPPTNTFVRLGVERSEGSQPIMTGPVLPTPAVNPTGRAEASNRTLNPPENAILGDVCEEAPIVGFDPLVEEANLRLYETPPVTGALRTGTYVFDAQVVNTFISHAVSSVIVSNFHGLRRLVDNNTASPLKELVKGGTYNFSVKFSKRSSGSSYALSLCAVEHVVHKITIRPTSNPVILPVFSLGDVCQSSGKARGDLTFKVLFDVWLTRTFRVGETQVVRLQSGGAFSDFPVANEDFKFLVDKSGFPLIGTKWRIFARPLLTFKENLQVKRVSLMDTSFDDWEFLKRDPNFDSNAAQVANSLPTPSQTPQSVCATRPQVDAPSIEVTSPFLTPDSPLLNTSAVTQHDKRNPKRPREDSNK